MIDAVCEEMTMAPASASRAPTDSASRMATPTATSGRIAITGER